MCHDDDWVNVAMADDSLVVDLLLRLNCPPPKLPPPCLNIRWTVRQRRSKSVPQHAAAISTSTATATTAAVGAHNKVDSTRASPTTPLSWSGATSASGGTLDGYEESSKPTKETETSRSKVANLSETTTTKRSKRKKTLAELKEEENLLLKERSCLKSELASLRLTVEKHRATNESLKRMKLDVEPRQNTSAVATASDVFTKAVTGPSHPCNSGTPETVTHDDSPVYAANASPKAQEISNHESTFVLPDLNLPLEEDFSTNANAPCIEN